MILNITIAGRSTEHELHVDHENYSDDDIRHMAAEIKGIPPTAFDSFVVDRLAYDPDVTEARIYIRPKVPFGSTPAEPKKRDDRSLVARMAANILSGARLSSSEYVDGEIDGINGKMALGAVKLARAILKHIDETSK